MDGIVTLNQTHLNDWCNNGIWQFAKTQSIWPLPHVIFAYHSYMYTRNWMSVLITYYMFVAIELLIFGIIGLEYKNWFYELFDHSPNPSDGYYLPGEDPWEGWCSINSSALFIGGSIQIFLGIVMGMVHIQFYSLNKYQSEYFYPVSYWSDGRKKSDKEYKTFLKKYANYLKEIGLGIKYGAWPWHLLFGLEPDTITLYNPIYNQHREDELNRTRDPQERAKIEKEWEETSKEFTKLVSERWRFRKVFWARWIQLFFLGTPATLFYGTVGEGPIRSGIILYGLITICLLAIFKVSNERDYISSIFELKKRKMMQEGKSITATTNHFLPTAERIEWHFGVMMNSYERLYLVWILTCAFIMGFQMLPILTGFYKVLISSTIVVIFTLLVNGIKYIIQVYRKCQRKKRKKTE